MLYRDYRRVEGYDDYIISNYGEVFSTKKHNGTEWRELKRCHNTNGYETVGLVENGKRKTTMVHVLVGNAFIGKRTNGLTFDHIDICKTNNHADNIRLATRMTQSQNRRCKCDNKLGEKHISIANRKWKGKILPCYRIIIVRNKKVVFNKDLGFRKYSLEDAVKIRDEKIKEIDG